MADYRDPAIRLHNLLSAGMKVGDAAKVEQAWRTVLSLEDASRSRLLEAVGRVIALPSEIRAEFDRRSIPESPTLDTLGRIENGLANLNFAAPWRQVQPHFTPEALQGLKIASARELSRDAAAQDVSDGQLDELVGLVREAIDAAAAVDGVDRKLQWWVVDHLRHVERAIVDFRVDGGETLDRLIRCAMGEVSLDPHLRQAHMDREPILVRFWRTTGRVASVLAISSALSLMPPSHEPAVDINIENIEVTNIERDGLPTPLLDAVRDLARLPELEAGVGGETRPADRPPQLEGPSGSADEEAEGDADEDGRD